MPPFDLPQQWREGRLGCVEAGQEGGVAGVLGEDAGELRKVHLDERPLLTATPLGDVLELRPGGSWTATNAAALERLSDAVAQQLERSNTVRLDMADVRELDTFGAWLLEKCHGVQRRLVTGLMSRA